MYFRCMPGLGTRFNTKMVEDIVKALTCNYEKKFLSLRFPEALDFLFDIEKVASNTL